MARDQNVELSTAELLDALERGQRLYRGFENALEVARRVANLEGAERDLLKRADEAKALCDSVEQDCAKRMSAAQAVAQSSEQSAERIVAEAQAEADRIISQSIARASASVQSAQESVQKHAAMTQQEQSVLDELYRKIAAASGELSKIEKQLEDARAAKKALLEA